MRRRPVARPIALLLMFESCNPSVDTADAKMIALGFYGLRL